MPARSNETNSSTSENRFQTDRPIDITGHADDDTEHDDSPAHSQLRQNVEGVEGDGPGGGYPSSDKIEDECNRPFNDTDWPVTDRWAERPDPGPDGPRLPAVDGPRPRPALNHQARGTARFRTPARRHRLHRGNQGQRSQRL